ncbi:hypothetical protein H0A66_06455 [Alcaligenaceae bacterium]|nr:hypothetical protein [Alcaligenaceae bacterium]
MRLFAAACQRSAARLFALLALSLGLAACSTTGNSFDSSALRFIVVGQTTLEQASGLLQADPSDIYRRLDGSAMARWSHKNSLLTDAIYLNQELWLDFGPDGYFQKVVKSVNLPLLDTHEGGRRVGTSPAALSTTTTTGSAAVISILAQAVTPPANPTAAPASRQADPVSGGAADSAIYNPAVSYPLPQ